MPPSVSPWVKYKATDDAPEVYLHDRGKIIKVGDEYHGRACIDGHIVMDRKAIVGKSLKWTKNAVVKSWRVRMGTIKSREARED